MKVTVSRIDPRNGFSFRETMSPSAVDALVGDYQGLEAAAQLDVSAELSRRGARVVLCGHLAGTMRGSCSRCLEAVEQPVDADVRSVFVPSIAAPEADGELELSAEDADLLPYAEDEIDLEPWVRESLLLEVSPYLLCRKDCAGLCPRCGANLNHETCACTLEPVDPRWSALLELKRKP